MKKMILLLMVTAFVAATAFVAIADNGSAVIELEAKMGTVTLDHTKHQGLTECATCHHTGKKTESCKSCHDAKPEAPKSKAVFHKLCKDCHKKNKPAPTKCKGCHIK